MVETGELVGDGMLQFCGRSKESHISHGFFDGGGVGWFRRYGVTRFGVRSWPLGNNVCGWMAEIPWSEIVCDGKCDRVFFSCCLLALDNDVVP
jgi:hypothetical protein